MAAATGALWAAGPLRSRASAAIESVQTTTGRESARVSALDSFSSAALRAKSSARVLEQRELAATRTSWVSPLGNEMVAPPPPSMTPPEAELSDQIQVAFDGSSARRSSA